MFQSKGMTLSTETCCKQIFHIQKKWPLVVIHGIFLCLCHHYNVINQIKIISWSLAHLMWNTLNEHASFIHVKEFHTVAACIKDITIFTPMQDEVFSLKFGAPICEVILNSHTEHWTRSFWTGPRGVKPRPASPNRHVISALFWDITQQESGNSLTTFQADVSVPASRVKKSMR